ncbi:MAG: hypothetical protein GVY06_06195 [Alphaproteobacteria bacterium]|jgi:hypothetical protein|nr:hypothetical protein [Alphaproteobacteria bacterium]
MRFALIAFVISGWPVVAMADGQGLSGAPEAPASLKPRGHDGPACNASVETSYPVAGLRVTRGRGPSSACDVPDEGLSGQDERTAVQVSQQVVIVERPYRWRSDFATHPRVLGAPRPRRY